MARPTPEAQKRRYWWLKQTARCVSCQAPGVETYVRCVACRAKIAQLMRRWRARKLAQGVCIVCGREAAIPGKVRCVRCTLRQGSA